MADLHKLTIAELLEKLAAGECSSVDIVTDVLASIDASDGKVGAYLTLERDDALAQAKVADERRAAGSILPMLGIPVAIKGLAQCERAALYLFFKNSRRLYRPVRRYSYCKAPRSRSHFARSCEYG